LQGEATPLRRTRPRIRLRLRATRDGGVPPAVLTRRSAWCRLHADEEEAAPVLLWVAIPVLGLLWAQVVLGVVHVGTGRPVPRWAGWNRIQERGGVVTRAGVAGFVTLGLATSPSMPWHAGLGPFLAQESRTWLAAMAGAVAVPAGLAWLMTRRR
jgi:hypothetical protein